MIWVILALCAALADGIKSVFQRTVLKIHDAAGYAFIDNLCASIIFGSLAAFSWKPSTEPIGWIYLLAAAALWIIIAYLTALSAKHTQVSIRAPIAQTRILFALVFGMVLFGEHISTSQMIGVFLIFLGAAVITWKGGRVFGNIEDRGVQLTLLVAPLGAAVALIDKQALAYFNPETYALFVYGIPTIVLGAYALLHRGNRKSTNKLIQTSWRPMSIAIILGAVAYYLTLHAYTQADASLVFAVTRASTIISVIAGGIVFKEERAAIGRRITAAIIIIMGVLLASGKFMHG